MSSGYPLFDRSKLTRRPLAERRHDLTVREVLPLAEVDIQHPEFEHVARAIVRARQERASVVLMMGAHVLRSGVQRYLIDLMERGFISGLAGNGACAVHDYELALIGATTESVARYIQDGQFGLWRETGRLNDVIGAAAAKGMGLGEAVGREIEQGDYRHKDISLLAAAYRLKVPFTIHVGIGYDIIHEHPNCDGAALGAASYTDFLIFTKLLENLARGVVMNFGSAVMSPEVFLKALAMVRNVAARDGKKLSGFTSLVCDLHSLPAGYRCEAARGDPNYYYRPWKTLLVRTVADMGTSYYVEGRHADTVPQLWTAIGTDSGGPVRPDLRVGRADCSSGELSSRHVRDR